MYKWLEKSKQPRRMLLLMLLHYNIIDIDVCIYTKTLIMLFLHGVQYVYMVTFVGYKFHTSDFTLPYFHKQATNL